MDIALPPLAVAALFLLKATGVLLLTGATAVVLRRSSAGTRHVLWLAALALIVALPLLASTLPRWRVLPAPASLRAASTLAAAGETPAAAPMIRTESEPQGWTAPPQPDEGAVRPSARGLEAEWFGALPRPSGATIALLVWALGTLLVLGRLAFSAIALRRTLVAATPLTSGEWTRPLWEACDRLDLSEAPRLLASDEVEMPFACGLLRPTIVLPAGAAGWSAERRRAVLFHELAHIRRRDLLGHTLGRFACALYWFHPLVWTAARRLRAESERACDDMVLSAGTPASEYADHLLQILVGVRGGGAPAVALPLGRRREFEGRMLAILDPALRRRGSRALHAGVLGALSLGALSLMAMAPAVPLSRTSTATLATVPSPGDVRDVGPDALHTPTVKTIVGPRGQSVTVVTETPAPSHDPHPDDPFIRLEMAAEKLGVEMGTMAIDAVSEFFGGSMNAGFLAATAEQKNIPLLIRLLGSDPDADVRRTAAWGLAGEPAAEPRAALIRALAQDADMDVREMAAWALSHIGAEDATAALAAAAQRDGEAEVRARALWALAQGSPGPITQQALARGLSDTAPEVRHVAAWAAGNHPPASTPGALPRLLGDENEEVRVAAAWALGQIGEAANRPALLAAFEREPGGEARVAMLWALMRVGPIDGAIAEELIQSDDPELRARAARIAAGAVEAWPWPWPWPEPRPIP